jgi:hypothetical protein
VRAKEQAIIDAKKKAALAKPTAVIPGVKPGMTPDEIITAKLRAAAQSPTAPKPALPTTPEEDAAREAKIRAWREELERANKKE